MSDLTTTSVNTNLIQTFSITLPNFSYNKDL